MAANEGEQWRYHLRLDMEFDDVEELAEHLKELIGSIDAAQAEHMQEHGEDSGKILSFAGMPECEHQHGYFGVDVRPVWPGRGNVH